MILEKFHCISIEVLKLYTVNVTIQCKNNFVVEIIFENDELYAAANGDLKRKSVFFSYIFMRPQSRFTK